MVGFMSGGADYLVRLGADHHNSQRALICIAQAGAGVNAFRHWPKSLNDVITVWAACLPGRETFISDTPLDSIAAMADCLLPGAANLDAQDLFVFGHCSGALVAYELVRRLASQPGRRRNLCLIVSGQPSPFIDVRRASSDYSVPELVTRLRDLGGTPTEILESAEFMELMAPTIRADFRANDLYRCPADRDPLDVPVIVLGSKKDGLAREAQLAAWKEVTTVDFGMHLFDAGHFFLYDQSEAVLKCLHEVCARPA
jgi:medium-chain acyl-[acyl-carrier-protein] hydrolase